MGRLSIAALPRTAFHQAVRAVSIRTAVETSDGAVIPFVIWIVIWDFVHVA